MKVANQAGCVLNMSKSDYQRLISRGIILRIIEDEDGICPYCGAKGDKKHIAKCYEKAPLISIVIPSRVEEEITCIPSIENQTWKKYEIITEYDTKQEGASAVRNRGFAKAKGKYVFFCDNDVDLSVNCLEVLYRQLIKDKADLCHGRIQVDSYITPRKDGKVPKNQHSEAYIRHFYQVSTMTLIRSSVKPKFDEKLKRFDDWDLWICLDKKGYKATWVDDIILKTTNRKTGLSMQNNYEEWMDKLYKKHKIDSKKYKIADIIIPHHNRHDLLETLYSGIDKNIFNIIMVSGGTFAENCNRGARIAETDTLIFLNDDVVTKQSILEEMAEADEDICGVSQIVNGRIIYGMGWSGYKATDNFLAEKKEDVVMPSGYCFKVSKSVWEELGGFDERFINGAEDCDLFLKAMKKKIKFGYIDEPMIHLHSQSQGRYDKVDKNFKLFNKIWEHKIQKIL